MAKEPEIYVSTDIEADGPIPGPNSMLSFASVALLPDKTELGVFTANLETLPGAVSDPRVENWWKQFPDAYARTRENPRDPAAVMPDYLAWLKALPGKPIFVGWPASYDFLWVYWYLVRFTGERPFGENALDIRSYAMGMRKSEFRLTARSYLPKRWWDDGLPHTHVALDDAREQGMLFCNMLAENVSKDAE
jgi:hypothetical protein